MIELPVTLTSTGGAVSFASPVPLGYTKNKGVYRLLVTAEGEWEGLTIRCFWHLPGGTDPASSLVQDGFVDVPASVTAHPGNGCITFEGSDGVKTVTSADLRYRVGSNSGTEDGTMPEPGTPAWEQLVSETKANADAAERAKNDAQAAAEGVKTAATKADEAAQKAEGAAQRAETAQKATEQAEAAAAESIAGAKKEALSAISTGEQGALGAVQQAQTTATEAVQAAQTAAEAAVSAAKTNAVQEVEAAAKPAQTAASKAEEAAELATQAGIAASNAADDAAGSAVAAGNAASDAAKSAQAALESKTAAAISEGNAAASAKKAQDVADSLPEDYVTAVNDIAALKTNKADKADLETVKQQIGNLDDLTTKAKETLVAAINEAARTGSGGAGSMDLRVADGYVQYSTDSGVTWTNLIAVAELNGKSAYQYAQDGGYTGTEEEFAAKLAEEMPDKLPNPNALTFTGAVEATYDGSNPMTVKIPHGTINVKDFGAVGDGRTDDTKAIQNAIDYVAQTDGGGLVYFPTGVYLITKPLVLTTVRIGTDAGTRYWDGNGVTLVGEHVAKTKIVKTGTAVYSGSETYTDSKKQSFAQTAWDTVIIGTGEATGHRIENLTLENQSSAVDTYTVVSWISRITLENINSAATHGINLYSYFNRLENIRFNGSSDVLRIDDGTSTFVSRTFVSGAQNPYYIKSAYSTLSNMAADGCTGSIYQVGGAGVVMIGCGAESPDATYHIYCPVNDTELTVVGGMFYGQTTDGSALVGIVKNRCKVTLLHPCITFHAATENKRYLVHTTKATTGIAFSAHDLSYYNASGHSAAEYEISDVNPSTYSYTLDGRPIDYIGNPLDWRLGSNGAEFWDGSSYTPAVYRVVTPTNYNVNPTAGKRLTADGEADYNGWISDYIPCTAGDIVYGKVYINDNSVQGLAMYDSNKNLLKYIAFKNLTNAAYGVTYNEATTVTSGATNLALPIGIGSGWNPSTSYIRVTGHNKLAPGNCPFTVNEATNGKTSDFALRSELPNKTSDLTNDSGYLTLDDLPIYNGSVI